MRDALLALPASYAEPLALQVLGGFSCAEIARMIGTTEGATMTRLTRARQDPLALAGIDFVMKRGSVGVVGADLDVVESVAGALKG